MSDNRVFPSSRPCPVFSGVIVHFLAPIPIVPVVSPQSCMCECSIMLNILNKDIRKKIPKNCSNSYLSSFGGLFKFRCIAYKFLCATMNSKNSSSKKISEVLHWLAKPLLQEYSQATQNDLWQRSHLQQLARVLHLAFACRAASSSCSVKSGGSSSSTFDQTKMITSSGSSGSGRTSSSST